MSSWDTKIAFKTVEQQFIESLSNFKQVKLKGKTEIALILKIWITKFWKKLTE